MTKEFLSPESKKDHYKALIILSACNTVIPMLYLMVLLASPAENKNSEAKEGNVTPQATMRKVMECGFFFIVLINTLHLATRFRILTKDSKNQEELINELAKYGLVDYLSCPRNFDPIKETIEKEVQNTKVDILNLRNSLDKEGVAKVTLTENNYKKHPNNGFVLQSKLLLLENCLACFTSLKKDERTAPTPQQIVGSHVVAYLDSTINS